jgi:hypothetical protein
LGTIPATPTTAPTAVAIPVAGKHFVVKDNPVYATRRSVLFLAKDAAIDTTGIDPIADGAMVQLYNANGSGESVCIALPSIAGSWRASGPPAKPRYRYKDAAFADGPCKTASIAIGNGIKVACSAKHAPIAYSLDEPSQGAMAVRLTSGGTTWCAVFGGRVMRDAGTELPLDGGRGQFSATDAPPPSTCPPAPVPCP